VSDQNPPADESDQPQPLSEHTEPEPAPEPVAPDEPAVTAEPPAAAVDEPAPPVDEPASPVDEPAPPVDEPGAAVEEPGAAVEEPVAVVEEPVAAAPPPPPPPPPAAPVPPPPPPPAAAVPPPPAAYPPPPPGYAAAPVPHEVAARGGLSVGDAIGYGWQGFKSNVGPILLIALVAILVSGGFNFLASTLENDFLRLIFSLIGFVVGFFIALGLIRAALTITDGQKPNVGELFQGEGVAQYAIASIVLGIAFTVLNFLGLITILLFPVTLIATLVLSFFVQFFGYSILDEKVSAFEGISHSFDVVRKNFGDLLVLWLAALAINIVGALLCGVGLLVSIPVTAIAWAYAWRRITGGVVAPQQA
jgi:uncharacterized membrane protein